MEECLNQSFVILLLTANVTRHNYFGKKKNNRPVPEINHSFRSKPRVPAFGPNLPVFLQGGIPCFKELRLRIQIQEPLTHNLEFCSSGRSVEMFCEAVL
jgi:hypothetical protein